MKKSWEYLNNPPTAQTLARYTSTKYPSNVIFSASLLIDEKDINKVGCQEAGRLTIKSPATQPKIFIKKDFPV